MLDWLALWEVDQWGPKRDDLRAVCQLVWDRSDFDFDAIPIHFPYAPDDSDDDLIELLDKDAEDDGAAT